VIALNESGSGITFKITVQPRAKRNAIAGEMDDALKIALTAPPTNGRANKACIEFLANLLNISRASISIISGHNSRNKVIRLTAISADKVRERLTS
jgi:uncharacterized protein